MNQELLSIRAQVNRKIGDMWEQFSKGKVSKALAIKREIDELEKRDNLEREKGNETRK